MESPRQSSIAIEIRGMKKKTKEKIRKKILVK